MNPIQRVLTNGDRGRTDTSVSYHLVSKVGVTVDTFSDEPLARKRLGQRKNELPGAEIIKVTTTVTRERVYKPRLAVVR